jgi:hypothetical protein
MIEVFDFSPLSIQLTCALPLNEVLAMKLLPGTGGSSWREDVAVANDAIDDVFLFALVLRVFLRALAVGRATGKAPGT